MQTQHEKSQTAYIREEEYGLDADPDYLQSLTGTSLSTDTSVIKFSRKSDHSHRRYKLNCGKMPYIAMLKNPSKTF